MIKVTFPDGNVKEYSKGISPLEIAKSISHGLASKILVASINDKVWDLERPLTDDCAIKLFTWDDREGKETYWHSSAHLMAEALEELYPETKFGIGPPIEAGFYYDIDLGGKSLSSEDLGAIEKKMRQLIGF